MLILWIIRIIIRRDRMKRRPTHPGVVLLEDVIKPLNLTITDAAKMLGVSRHPKKPQHCRCDGNEK